MSESLLFPWWMQGTHETMATLARQRGEAQAQVATLTSENAALKAEVEHQRKEGAALLELYNRCGLAYEKVKAEKDAAEAKLAALREAAEEACLAFANAHQPHHDNESAGYLLNDAWVKLSNAVKKSRLRDEVRS